MKKIILGFIIGIVVATPIISNAWDYKTTELRALNEIGALLDKIYSKQKSIDEYLAELTSDIDEMEDKVEKGLKDINNELDYIQRNTR